MRNNSRVSPEFMQEQKARRAVLADAPGQAGGLPELNERIEVIETILALHAPEEIT